MLLSVELMLKMQAKTFNLLLVLLVCAINHQVSELESMEQYFKVIKLHPYYDSMVCKLICHGRNRTEAIQRMNRSLDEFVIEGITTTIPLHKILLSHKKFINSDFNVSWLDKEKII